MSIVIEIDCQSLHKCNVVIISDNFRHSLPCWRSRFP